MILTTNVKKKIYQYLLQKLGMYDYRRGWLKGDCPYCGSHKFGVNLGMNRSNCFRCEARPSPLNLIMDVQGFTIIPEVLKYLNIFEGLNYYEEEVKPYKLKDESSVSLPPGYRNISRGDSQLARAARRYLSKRGFDIKKLSEAGWGYCVEGDYWGYIIIPFYMGGRLVYFNARLFAGDGPKYNNPNIEDFGLGKSMLIYNLDSLGMYKTVYIVESAMNARTIGDNAIATGGKAVSGWQRNVIIKSPVEKVIIGLDDDAIEDAVKLALKFHEHKKVKIMQFPQGKDINDLGRKKSLRISHTSKYLNYNDILSLKLNL